MTSRTILRRSPSAAALTAAALMLAACSSSGATSPMGPTLPQTQASKLEPNSARSDSCSAKSKKDLYVANFGDNDVLAFCNEQYVQVDAITNGVSGPADVALDQSGNLYVANFNNGSAGSITEYAPPHFSSPTFTYSAGMSGPQTLTVDSHGDVFEGDQKSGTVNEYSQGVNSAIASCSLGGDVSGVAVDAAGDVFVRFFSGVSETAHVAEYDGGLSGCNQKILPVAFSHNGGIALDKKQNLIVCDGSRVDVLDPPYTAISGTIGSGFNFAFGVSLNKKNDLAFVADYIADTVTVVSYPQGTNQTVLTSQSGISEPFGAVDSPNAVY